MGNHYDPKEEAKREPSPFLGTDERAQHAVEGKTAGVNVRKVALASLPVVKDHATAHEIIAERGTTHGDFDDNAALSQTLKDAIRGFQRKDGTYPWHTYSPAMKDSLDMFCAKIGRIAAGQAHFKDHWADIAGYAQLIADRCPE